jgi:nucleoside-diphosphate-sugar epimerase
MQVLVTGATGFVGRALVPALVGRGHHVTAAVRAAGATFPGATVVRHDDLAGDVDWGRLVDGCDAVVHLAGLAHATEAIPEDRYDRVNRAATAALAAAATGAGARRFVFVSSIRAQTGAVAGSVLSERDMPRPTDAYGRSKLAAEECVRVAGVPHTILRPVLVYGPELKGNLATLRRLAALPVPLPFGSFTNRRSLLALERLVSAIELSLESPTTVNQTYVVADRTPVELRDIVRALAPDGRRVRRLVPVPVAMLRPVLRLAGAWDRVGGELVVDASKLCAAGWRPVTDTCAELRRIARVP